ncbi:hypothetical protein [Candidatus Poriferisodalis sp.]|uniref:hypothetical protein n=1 Tax=Candidatus Poriferisodalis sp. TaxID=3101277 RepID=UPI003B01F4E4
MGLPARESLPKHARAPRKSLLVVLPLAGLALQSAERLSVYLNAAATGTNPLRAARHTWRLAGIHLDQGSFAPLGRLAEYLTHGVALEAGWSLSLAPHAVLGAVRLALGAVLVMFYDVAYLAPIIAAAFLVARLALARLATRAALATAAVRRWAAFSAGFATVFIPVRILGLRRGRHRCGVLGGPRRDCAAWLVLRQQTFARLLAPSLRLRAGPPVIPATAKVA